MSDVFASIPHLMPAYRASGTLIVENKRMANFCQTVGSSARVPIPHVFARKMRHNPSSFPKRTVGPADERDRID
jgi:hypothetical protein